MSLVILFCQVLALVGARWLAGLIFRWGDLEILDDPIPSKLYCQYFRNKNHDTSLAELEERDEPDIDSKPGGKGMEWNKDTST